MEPDGARRSARHLCRTQAGSTAFSQLAPRRLLPAPKRASDGLKLRPASAKSAGWARAGLICRACFRRRHEQNVEANQKLQADLADWKGNPSPRAWWHSFGFNEKEGWREDGFSVAFAPEERQFARQYISVVKVTPWQLVGSPRARLLLLLRARLAALGGSVLPGRGRPTGIPAAPSAARASRLQTRPFRRL